MTKRKPTTRGFARTSTLLQRRIARVSESRGFAQSRLLTHWAEFVGEDFAAVSRPVKVTYGRQGLGATLVVLTTGSQAPMLEMQKEKLREKVNAVYGYNAISRIQITQSAPSGFAEGQVDFQHRATPDAPVCPDTQTKKQVMQMAAPVNDSSLRQALEALGQNVLVKCKR